MPPFKRALGAFAATSLVVTGTALAVVGSGSARADSTVPTADDLFISEVQPDNGRSADGTTGTTNIDDNYEFFEVTNTTGSDINLASDDIAISFSLTSDPATTPKWAVSNGIPNDTVTPGPLDVTIPAQGSTVFWLDYTTTASLNTYARSEADFRTFYDNIIPASTQIVRVEGQPGMSNGGSRTIALIVNGSVIGSSFFPPRPLTTPGISSHFQVPAIGTSAATYLRDGPPTPGTVTAEQLIVVTPPPPSPWTPFYPTPVIMGSPSVGKTLSVDPGVWTPQDTYLTFQWYADGQPLADADGTSLKLGGKQKGVLITVAVTGWYSGVATTMTSDPVGPVGGTNGNG